MRFLFLKSLITLVSVSSCKDDTPDPSKITVTLRSVDGLAPFPDGTQMGVFNRTGTSGTLIATLDFPALGPNEDRNVASFTYDGSFPVEIQIEKTEDPALPPPLEFLDPWFNSNQRFRFIDAGPKSLQIDYLPNFWLDINIYTEKPLSELELGRIQIGYDLDRIHTFLVSGDRQFIGDTMSFTTESWYYNNKNCSIYLADANSAQLDSLLFEVNGNQVLYHDTTYIFYDLDKDSGYVGY